MGLARARHEELSELELDLSVTPRPNILGVEGVCSINVCRRYTVSHRSRPVPPVNLPFSKFPGARPFGMCYSFLRLFAENTKNNGRVYGNRGEVDVAPRWMRILQE